MHGEGEREREPQHLHTAHMWKGFWGPFFLALILGFIIVLCMKRLYEVQVPEDGRTDPSFKQGDINITACLYGLVLDVVIVNGLNLHPYVLCATYSKTPPRGLGTPKIAY